eukprot:COSAG01_NODE_1135_length_11553_cov_40.402305_3_plen_255_part_00
MRYFFCFLLFFLVPLYAQTSRPVKPLGWAFNTGLLFMHVPDYPGAKDYKQRVFPFWQAAYQKSQTEKWDIAFNGLTYEHQPLSFLKAKYAFGFHFGRDESESDLFEGWGDISFAPKFTLSHRLAWRMAFLESRFIYHFGALNKAVLYELALGHGIYIPGLRAFGSLSYFLDWGNQNYLQRFYGVPDSLAGLAAFSPASGLRSRGWRLNLIKPLNSKWTLVMPLSFLKYDKRLAKSAVIQASSQRALLFILNYKL